MCLVDILLQHFCTTRQLMCSFLESKNTFQNIIEPIPQHSEAFQEICFSMKTTRLNCRYTHCFMDEDMLGTMKGLARRVHRRALELRVLGRWLLRIKTFRSKTTIPVRRPVKKR